MQVDLLEFDTAQPVDNALQKIASWGCASKAAFLSVQRIPRPADTMDDDDAPSVLRERLHVGDSVKSVYVLELAGSKLVDVARDYMQNWVVAMEELNANDGSVVISDVSNGFAPQSCRKAKFPASSSRTTSKRSPLKTARCKMQELWLFMNWSPNSNEVCAVARVQRHH